MKLLAAERCVDCFFSKHPAATPEQRKVILKRMRETGEALYCHAFGNLGGLEPTVMQPAVRCRADYDRRKDPGPVDRIVYPEQGAEYV